MNSLENARNLIIYIQKSVFNTLKETLFIVPEEKFSYSPGKNLNTLKYLLYHVISSPYVYLLGIGRKEITSLDYKSVTIDIDRIQNPKDLVTYYDKFYTFMGFLKTKIRLAELQQSIIYNFDSIGFGMYTLTGQKALETAFEEMVHHRGQIYIYLRELRIEPPPLYRHLTM